MMLGGSSKIRFRTIGSGFFCSAAITQVEGGMLSSRVIE